MLVTNRRIVIPSEKMSIFMCGMFGSIMMICYSYSADPERIHPIMQTTLLGLRIIPSVLATRYILHKKNQYDISLIISSLGLLFLSVSLTFIPLETTITLKSLLWISMFLVSIICTALYYIYQQKYIINTFDSSIANEAVLIFWTSFIQMVLIGSCYWVEYLIGHTNNPNMAFKASINQFTSNIIDISMLELYIIAYLAAYVVTKYLNSLLTDNTHLTMDDYTMIINAGSGLLVIVFFSVFNTSVQIFQQYPWYTSLSCVVLNILSVFLWIISKK
jgi:hypothetical protein